MKGRLFLIGAICFLLILLLQFAIERRNQGQAINLVSELQEIKDWESRLAEAKANSKVESRPIVRFDRKDDGLYVIHAFELVSDGNNRAHSATFNWYHVNMKTREAKAQF